MLNEVERIAIVSARRHGITYEQVRKDFSHIFTKPDLTRLSIKKLNKIQCTDSVTYEERIGRQVINPFSKQSLNQAFNSRQISRASARMWASCHPDFTPFDLFGIWVYQVKIGCTVHLTLRILPAPVEITPDVLLKAFYQQWFTGGWVYTCKVLFHYIEI